MVNVSGTIFSMLDVGLNSRIILYFTNYIASNGYCLFVEQVEANVNPSASIFKISARLLHQVQGTVAG